MHFRPDKRYNRYTKLIRFIDKIAWETMKREFNYTCPCCGKSEPEIKLTKDHISPKSKGGIDDIRNIQPLCESCNKAKAATIDVFLPFMERN